MRRKVVESKSRDASMAPIKSINIDTSQQVQRSKFLVLLFLLMINISAWSQSVESLEKNKFNK